jgi:hypothetical protein
MPVTVFLPVPLNVPPLQFNFPETVKAPVPLIVPLVRFKTPLVPTVLTPFRVRVKPLLLRVWVPLVPPRVNPDRVLLRFKRTV